LIIIYNNNINLFL
jgi:hypothetical protein